MPASNRLLKNSDSSRLEAGGARPNASWQRTPLKTDPKRGQRPPLNESLVFQQPVKRRIKSLLMIVRNREKTFDSVNILRMTSEPDQAVYSPVCVRTDTRKRRM
jgi:hypothetical protein